MAGWSDRQTWQARDDAQRWADLSTEQLRELIAHERERGKAFGVYAEAARLELAKRGEK
jgi:hypothetical protein